MVYQLYRGCEPKRGWMAPIARRPQGRHRWCPTTPARAERLRHKVVSPGQCRRSKACRRFIRLPIQRILVRQCGGSPSSRFEQKTDLRRAGWSFAASCLVNPVFEHQYAACADVQVARWRITPLITPFPARLHHAVTLLLHGKHAPYHRRKNQSSGNLRPRAKVSGRRRAGCRSWRSPRNSQKRLREWS